MRCFREYLFKRVFVFSLLLSFIFLFQFTCSIYGADTVLDFEDLEGGDIYLSDGSETWSYNGFDFSVDGGQDEGLTLRTNTAYGDVIETESLAPGNLTTLTIKKSDENNFQFKSIWLNAEDRGDSSVTVEGYMNNLKIITSEVENVSSAAVLNYNWTVDEIRVVGPDLWLLFDKFTYGEIIVNNEPVINISSTTLSYTEGNQATLIDATATLSDVDGDSDWDGGTLKVQITGNPESSDEISIADTDGDGTAITISGTDIFSNATDIGDLSANGGLVTGGTVLTITFDSNATNANVLEVLQSIRYRTTSTHPSGSDRTVTVTATDKNGGNNSDSRTISLTLVDDEAPTIETNNGLTLNEGATKTIEISDLKATDSDSDDSTLTYTITTSPSNGQIENSDNSGVSIITFTHQNLIDNKIRYVHDDSNTTSDNFAFKVSDTIPNDLTGQTFNITINPIDDDVATMSVNNSLTLYEGASALITSGELAATDTDTDDTTLIFTITSSLSNGQIENVDNPGIEITVFTQQNLIDKKIRYVHDGSNTTSDHFVFKVADGTPNEITGQTFNMFINAVDDDAPTILNNNCISLNEGDSIVITTSAIKATDTETDDNTIVYTITTNPVYGQLEDITNSGTAITSFTQQDLIDEKVKYIHDDSNTFSDSFVVTVSDTASNELTGQTFNLSINPIDDDKPVITTNNGCKVNVNEAVTITTSNLDTTDNDSSMKNIIYVMTTQPLYGYIENTDVVGTSISAFFHEDIQDGKIRYVNDGTKKETDSFDIEVSDGTNTNAAVTFNIEVIQNAELLSIFTLSDSTPGSESGDSPTNAISWEISVANSAATVSETNIVAFGSKITLCTDAAFTNEIASDEVINLAEGAITKIYVKVEESENATELYYAVSITRAKRKSSSSGSSSNNTSTDVMVDGEKQSVGESKKTYEDGKQKTTVTLDNNKLENILKNEEDGVSVTIAVENKSDIVTGVINGEMMKEMESKEAEIVIKTDKATYSLPAEEIKLGAISKELGESVDIADIEVEIEIAEPKDEEVKIVENAAKNGDFAIMVPPINFTVKCNYKDKSVEVDKFDSYVERIIAVPDDIDPQKVTTGIIVYPDGSTCHVPTQVIEVDGNYFVKINSLTNSTYSVIWNPKEYEDLDNHWAKEECNDMGSRLIVKPESENAFEPDKQLSRVAFTQIVVNALGLGENGTGASFTDISSEDELFGAISTAVEYNLIKGYQDNTFRADNTITREEAAVLMVRVMKVIGLNTEFTDEELSQELNKFVDESSIQDWSRKDVAICVKNGLIIGNQYKEFTPKGNITKAELATIVKRMLTNADLI